MVAHSDIAYIIDARGQMREVLSTDTGVGSRFGVLVRRPSVGADEAHHGFMRRRRRRSLASVASLVLALVGGALISACSSSPASPPTRPAVGGAEHPLQHHARDPAGYLGRRPHGRLERAARTRSGNCSSGPPGLTKWSLVTPPGVALNGGLTIASCCGPAYRRHRADQPAHVLPAGAA